MNALNSLAVGRGPLAEKYPDFSRPMANGQRPTDKHQQLVHSAQQLVSQTFFGQMLKQMRNDPFRSKLFDGGRGGEMFGALLDQKLADKMARGVGNKLVNAIVDRMEKISPHSAVPASPAPAAPLEHPAGDDGAVLPKPNPFKNVRIYVAPGLRA